MPIYLASFLRGPARVAWKGHSSTGNVGDHQLPRARHCDTRGAHRHRARLSGFSPRASGWLAPPGCSTILQIGCRSGQSQRCPSPPGSQACLSDVNPMQRPSSRSADVSILELTPGLSPISFLASNSALMTGLRLTESSQLTTYRGASESWLTPRFMRGTYPPPAVGPSCRIRTLEAAPLPSPAPPPGSPPHHHLSPGLE